MEKNVLHLKIAGVLQIILGVILILVTYFLVGNLTEEDLAIQHLTGAHALKLLVLNYLSYVFMILIGLYGLVFAKKKSLLAVIFGIILFIPRVLHFINLDGNIYLIIINIICLLFPYYYLHNAYMLYKNK